MTRKLVGIALVCVLVAFMCVSCTSYTETVIDGEWVFCDKDTTWKEWDTVSFDHGSIEATIGSSTMYGTYTVSGSLVYVRWEDHTKVTLSIDYDSRNGYLYITDVKYKRK